jgi:hypothetical protein
LQESPGSISGWPLSASAKALMASACAGSVSVFSIALSAAASKLQNPEMKQMLINNRIFLLLFSIMTSLE